MTSCKKTNMFMKAIKKAGGGKVQTSSDTARKLAKEMGGMKKGGAAMPREGISTRPTGPGGRRITMKDLEQSNRDTGGMSAAQIKAAGEAIKRGNRTPYEPIPKKAMGGMLGKVAQAKQGAVKPAGGMLGKVVQAAAKQGLSQPIGKVVQEVSQKGLTPSIMKMLKEVNKGSDGTQRFPTPIPVAKVLADKAAARQAGREMAPIKRAKGGAGKVRKGMMSKSGDILQAVKPKKGIGGIM